MIGRRGTPRRYGLRVKFRFGRNSFHRKQKEILHGRGEGAWDRVGGATWRMQRGGVVWSMGRAASPMH